jgi:hypothetical protein
VKLLRNTKAIFLGKGIGVDIFVKKALKLGICSHPLPVLGKDKASAHAMSIGVTPFVV